MVDSTEGYVALLCINGGLTVLFLVSAWKLNQLKRNATLWADDLASLEAELTNRLSTQPAQLRSLVTRLQNLRHTYILLQKNLQASWQVWVVIRFMLNWTVFRR